MTDWVVAHQALIREWINGTGMVLFLTLTFMISIFMWDTFVATASRDWTQAPGVPTACALWWVFAAETYRTGSVWELYQAGKFQQDAGVFFAPAGYGTSWGYMVAGMMLVGGLLRSIYIFTPPEWKRRVWVYASIASVVFCLVPTIASVITRITSHG